LAEILRTSVRLIRSETQSHRPRLVQAWSDHAVTVSAETAAVPPPVWPMSVKTVPAWTPGQDGVSADPAARLAEMVRRDPSLLQAGGG
jgi:hypothetical protein